MCFIVFVFSLNSGFCQFYTKDSLQNTLLTSLTSSERIKILLLLSDEFYALDNLKVLKHIKEAEGLAVESDLELDLAKVYRKYGNYYHFNGDYKKSIDYKIKSLDISKRINDTQGVASSYNNLAIIYYDIEEVEKSIEYFNLALKTFGGFEDYHRIGVICGNLGSVYVELEQYDSSKKYLEKSVDIFKNHYPYVKGMVKNMATLGVVHSIEGNKVLAVKLGDEAYRIGLEENDQIIKNEIYLSLSKIYFNLKNYQKAILFADSVLFFSTKLTAKIQVKMSYFLLASSYDSIHNYKLALQNYQMASLYKDSIINNKVKNEIKKLEYNHLSKSKDQNIELLKKDNEVLVQKKTMLIIGVLLLLLLLFFVYVYIKSRAKSIKIEQDLLKEKFDYSQKDLTNYALSIIQKNITLAAIKSDLLVLKKKRKEEEKQTIIKDLILKLQTEMSLESEILKFDSKLKEVGSEFYQKLDKQYPSLTKNERRLATMLRLDMSSKEIAVIVGISNSSVNVNRYRLRKKLCLPNETKLVDFFNQL